MFALGSIITTETSRMARTKGRLAQDFVYHKMSLGVSSPTPLPFGGEKKDLDDKVN